MKKILRGTSVKKILCGTSAKRVLRGTSAPYVLWSILKILWGTLVIYILWSTPIQLNGRPNVQTTALVQLNSRPNVQTTALVHLNNRPNIQTTMVLLGRTGYESGMFTGPGMSPSNGVWRLNEHCVFSAYLIRALLVNELTVISEAMSLFDIKCPTWVCVLVGYFVEEMMHNFVIGLYQVICSISLVLFKCMFLCTFLPLTCRIHIGSSDL